MAHAPLPHGDAAGFVKIDRVRADQRAAVIIDDVAVRSADDLKPCSERKVRPIRGRAHHIRT